MRTFNYVQAVAVSKARQLMRYGPQQFKEDWDTAIALAQLMAIHGPLEGQKDQLESCFTRIYAYLANNPDARPFGDTHDTQ